MLSLYLSAIVALSATTVLSIPARLNEARELKSDLSARNFYWQCAQGKSFVGNAPPNANPGSCTSCQPGTFSPDGVNCYTTPMGFYNDKQKAFNPIGCAAGFYTDTTGALICKACPATQMSYAAATKCMVCADGTTSLDGQYCTPCASGTYSTGGAACAARKYHIQILDVNNSPRGYLSSVNEQYGQMNIGSFTDALTIQEPVSFSGSTPIGLLATTLGTNRAGQPGPGYSLSATRANFGCSSEEAFISESQTDTRIESPAMVTDNGDNPGASQVWIIGAPTSANTWPLSLNVIPANSVTEITSLYFYERAYPNPNVWIACTSNTAHTSVKLYLNLVVAI